MRRNTESYHQHLKAERDEVEGLRSLLTSTPSEERRARVLAGLESKHEGAQSVATQVLGLWGDHESVELLRQRLVSLLARPDAFALRGVTVAALAPWIVPATRAGCWICTFQGPTGTRSTSCSSSHQLWTPRRGEAASLLNCVAPIR